MEVPYFQAARPLKRRKTGEEDDVEAPVVDEDKVLAALFKAIDFTIFLATRTRGYPRLGVLLERMRPDIEELTGFALSDERLVKVLVAANGMLRPVWIGHGSAAQLELRQGLGADAAEIDMEDRLQRFTATVEGFKGKLHAKEQPLVTEVLPPRPPSPQKPAEDTPPSSPVRSRTSASESGSPTVNSPGLDLAERQAAMRARVRAKKAMLDQQEVYHTALAGIEQKLSACENAVTMWQVLCRLFGQARRAPVPDNEVVRAVTGRNSAVRCQQPMDEKDAWAALDELVQASQDWFGVEQAVHTTKPTKYLRLLPKGTAAATQQALRLRRSALLKEREALLANGPETFSVSNVSLAGA